MEARDFSCVRLHVSYANNLNKGKGVIILIPKEGETSYAGMCTGNFTIGPASMKEDMKVKGIY